MSQPTSIIIIARRGHTETVWPLGYTLGFFSIVIASSI